ncbi:MAG: NAD(P)-dependent alcohol dehydrogenase, partial [Deltaproteobacteria bacterium]
MRRGSFAEFVVSSVDACARIPPGLGFDEAASLPLAGLTALQALRDLMHPGPGSTALIHGASGGVGTLAIQIAKALGARVVTTSSARNQALCRSLGADEALDYAATEPRDRPLSPARRFDAVFDVFGNLAFDVVRPVLAPRGVFVSTVPSPRILRDLARTLLTRGPRARL